MVQDKTTKSIFNADQRAIYRISELGIKNGIESIKDGPDYITPVNDTIYLPTSNGAETMTDALRESQNIVNITRRINGLENNLIKNNARYNFDVALKCEPPLTCCFQIITWSISKLPKCT